MGGFWAHTDSSPDFILPTIFSQYINPSIILKLPLESQMASSLLQLLLLQCAVAFILSAAGPVSAAHSLSSLLPAPVSVHDIYSNGGSEEDSREDDLDVATEEMRRANYFTFVMLLNMAVNNGQTAANVTFLMPNDRILSNITFTTENHDKYDNASSSNTATPTWSVREFILHHSIPSPLLFDHLWHFPSGSTIPSSHLGYVLQVQNDDKGHKDGKWWRRRGNFSLNNVKIISPNICTSPSSSIRCHGIDGVLYPAPISPPPVYYCAPKPAPAPSDHDHYKLAPNSAPSSNHFDYVGPGAESPPPSSHAPSSSSSSSHTPAITRPTAAAGVGLHPGPGFQLLLSLVMLLWPWD